MSASSERRLTLTVESGPMPLRHIHRAALTFTIARGDHPRVCARCGPDRRAVGAIPVTRRASSIARSLIRTPSRPRAPRSPPIRRTSLASSTSASPNPARGSFARPSRRSRAGSRSSRTTRCSCDGAGIDICRSVNSIARSPISRAAASLDSHDLRHLVPPRRRPVRARRFCRRGRVVRQGAADRPGCRRTGGLHGLVVDVAQPRRPRRGSEGDARCDRRPDSSR